MGLADGVAWEMEYGTEMRKEELNTCKCDFCGNNKFLSKRNFVVGVENHYIKETKDFVICSDCSTKLEDAKLKVEIDFVKQGNTK